MRRGEKTTCWATERDLEALLDGQLPAERRAAVLRHAEACARCADQLALARRARQLLLAMPREAPPEGVRAAIRAAVGPEAEVGAILRVLPRVAPPVDLAARIHEAIACEAAARQGALCARLARQLDALVDGELGEGEALALERHATRCDACGALLARARAAASALRSLPQVRPSPSCLAGIRAAVARERERGRTVARRTPAWAFATAAAACLAFLALAYGPGLLGPDKGMAVPGPDSTVVHVPERAAEEPSDVAAATPPEEPTVSITAPAKPTTSVRAVRMVAGRKASAYGRARHGAEREGAGESRPVTPKPDGAPDSFAPPAGSPIVVVASAAPPSSPEPQPDSGLGVATVVSRADQATLTL